MSIRLIALDLDGTLLRRDGTISPRTISALRRAMATGVTVTLATGRIHSSAAIFARRLGLNAPIISSNGGLIQSTVGPRLLHRPLPFPLVLAAPQIARETGAYLEMYAGDAMFVSAPARKRCDDRSLQRLLRVRSWQGLVNTFESLRAYGIFSLADWKPDMPSPEKVMVVHRDPYRLRVAGDLVLKLTDGRATVSSSGWDNLEVTAPGTDKGAGVAWLARHMGIPADQVMVMGDNQNDLSMFQFAGFPVAMGNATAELKAVARHVTESHMAEGVALAVERFVLG